MARSRSLRPARRMVLAVIAATGILMAIPTIHAAEKKSGSAGASKTAPSISVPSKVRTGGATGGTTTTTTSPAARAAPSRDTGGATTTTPTGPVTGAAPSRDSGGGTTTDPKSLFESILGKPPTATRKLPAERQPEAPASTPEATESDNAAATDTGGAEGAAAAGAEEGMSSGDDRVTIENGLVQIDADRDGVPDVIIPEEWYDPETGGITLPDGFRGFGTDPTEGDIFQADFNGDGTPEFYTGKDSDGDGLIDNYVIVPPGYITGAGNPPDFVVGMPEVDLDGEVPAGSGYHPGSGQASGDGGGNGNGNGNDNHDGNGNGNADLSGVGLSAVDLIPEPDNNLTPPPGNNGNGNGNGNGNHDGNGHQAGGNAGGARVGVIFTPPAPMPSGQTEAVPAGFDGAAIRQALAELKSVRGKQLISAAEHDAGQMRAMAGLNRRTASLEAGLGFLEQLKGEALVTPGPYGAKRQELLAGGAAPAAAPQAPAAVAPVAGAAQPRCSTVGGYEAYMRKTGRVCSCDTADC